MSDFSGQHKVETYKSMITISIEIFKALLLINGGAAAGMLATLDKLVRLVPMEAIRHSLMLFGAGVGLVMLAFVFSYFTQNTLHQENMGRARHNTHLPFVVLGTISALASMAAFVAGVYVAANALR
jgi:hypothetical protein